MKTYRCYSNWGRKTSVDWRRWWRAIHPSPWGFFSVNCEFSKCFTTDGIAIDAASSQHNAGGGFSTARDLKIIFSFVIIAAATAFITGCTQLPRIARKPIHHTRRWSFSEIIEITAIVIVFGTSVLRCQIDYCCHRRRHRRRRASFDERIGTLPSEHKIIIVSNEASRHSGCHL